MKDYTEPELTVLVLAFQRHESTRACLESVRHHIRIPHRVHLYHNGPTGDHRLAWGWYEAGLIDLFIMSVTNDGLGIGTRGLMASCHAPYFLYLQQDQELGRDLGAEEWAALKARLDDVTPTGYSPTGQALDIPRRSYRSISLAGPVAGHGVYSERAHVGRTSHYRYMEQRADLGLSPGGAGPYSHLPWREGQIQAYYAAHCWAHDTEWPPLVRDRGVWTVRDNPDGSRVWMRTDTKAVWWERAPKEPYVFPEMTPDEWETSKAGRWVGGTVPETYLAREGGSFRCWGPDEAPPYTL